MAKIENIQPILQPLCGIENKEERYCEACASRKKCFEGTLLFRNVTTLAEVMVPTMNKLEKIYEERDSRHLELTPIEQELYSALIEIGLFPKLQYQVGPYILDFAFIESNKKLDVEADGLTYHADPNQLDHDLKRNRYLQFKGWQILRFSGRDIKKNPMRCAIEIQEYLELIEEN